MNNNISIFNNDQFGEIRAVMKGDKPHFVGKDIAAVLGYSRPRDAVRDHCKGGVKMALPTISGIQEITVIPESDVYRLILRSRKPDLAKDSLIGKTKGDCGHKFDRHGKADMQR